jgi:hypothetical protein
MNRICEIYITIDEIGENLSINDIENLCKNAITDCDILIEEEDVDVESDGDCVYWKTTCSADIIDEQEIINAIKAEFEGEECNVVVEFDQIDVDYEFEELEDEDEDYYG